MRRRLFARALAVAILSLPFAGCGGDGATDPSANIIGTWALQTVSGQRLPFVIPLGGADRLEITSDRVTFSEGSSLRREFGYRLIEGGQTTTGTEVDGGSYTINGTAVSMNFDSADFISTATISGSTLTVAEDGESFVYRKE